MENTAKKMFDTMADMQKQAVETFSNMTENIQKNFSQHNTVDTDFFKKWYDSQMEFFNQKGDKSGENNPLEFFNTWMTKQMESAKNWFDTSKNPMMEMWNNQTEAKKAYDNSMEMFNNWMNTLNNSYGEMLKQFGGNNDAKDSFSNMFNNAQTYMKMFEIWMPMLKAVQNKTFTPEMFKDMFNTQSFKGMMDSIFNMQPEYMKNLSEQFNNSVKENMTTAMDKSREMYDNFRKNFNAYMPDASESFSKMNEMYQNFYSTVNNSTAPWMKLATPGTQKEQMEMLNEMTNEFNLYNMKNAQMQYMMYVTGLKAMEEVAETVYSKIRKGEEIKDFMNIYQEWLNINDKNFVRLFESEDYSKMQSELNSYGMKLKRKIDLQMEKNFSNLPLINRSEMDELYKTIYDLRKQMSQMAKDFAGFSSKKETVSETPVNKTTAKKTGKKA